MICQRCAKENDPGNRFCSRCGIELVAANPAENPGTDSQPCYKHPKELTVIRCGRCERPICTKCMVMGPAGQRCRECAKSNTKISARGVAHDISQPFKGLLRSNIGWYLIIFLVAPLLLGAVRGCSVFSGRESQQVRYERE